jgi:hypothetical protein
MGNDLATAIETYPSQKVVDSSKLVLKVKPSLESFRKTKSTAL